MLQWLRNLSDRAEFFIVLSVCFFYFTLTSAAALLAGVREIRLTPRRLAVGMLIEVAILVLVAVFLRIRGWNFRRLGFAFSWAGLAAGVPLFIWYILLYWAVFLIAVAITPNARHLSGVKFVPAAPTILFLVFILINSLFEEATVSGYVITALSNRGAALSIAASALLRFLYHLYQGPIGSPAILLLGLLFAAVYWKWRNLWPLMSAHTIANLLNLWLATHGAA